MTDRHDLPLYSIRERDDAARITVYRDSGLEVEVDGYVIRMPAKTWHRLMREARARDSYAGALTEAAQNMLDMIRGSDFDGLSWSDYLGDEGAKVLSALASAVASNPLPTLRSQEIGWQYTRAESGHVLWTCRRCKRQAWSPGTQPVACACDFRCCGASDPPCTDFDGSCKNPANYPPAKPAADEYTPGCNFPRCVCPDGKECSK